FFERREPVSLRPLAAQGRVCTDSQGGASMMWKGTRSRLLVAGALLVAFAATTPAWAQGMFYREVEKDGRIYVFASGQRYDTFEKGGGGEMGVAITRLGYGPNGETVVFDSEDAINLYNFKHNLPGEYFKKPEVKPPSPYPNVKFSGLMFGDYYWYDKWH